MAGRHIKVPGHAMKPPEKLHPYRWWCYCVSWGASLPQDGKTPSQVRRDGHDDHKIAVLRLQGKWEDEDA